MPSITYPLSLEELVAAFSLLDAAPAAKALLWSHTGQLSVDEERGRLIAAHHSLQARQLTVLRNDILEIGDELKALLQPVLQHRFSVRFQRAAPKDERVLVYYFGAKVVVRHEMHDGFVHEFAVARLDALASESARFLELPRTGTIKGEAELTQTVLDEAQSAARLTDGATAASRVLTLAHIPQAMSTAFGEDLAQMQWRGSLLKVEPKGNTLQSDQGYLLLRGAERLWLLEVQTRNEVVIYQLALATLPRLTEAINKLTK